MELNIEKILKSIVKDNSSVHFHNGWGFYIKTNFDEIQMIGLIPKENCIELSLFYGDSQKQSRAFYNGYISTKKIQDKNWKIIPNFHFSSTFRNLIWFESNLEPNEYIEYWRKNKNLLVQRNINEIPKLIKKLSKDGVIILDKAKEVELKKVIYEKDYSLINICAGFGVIYPIVFSEKNSPANSDVFAKFLIEKINEGLSIINKNANNLFINFSSNLSNEKSEGDPNGL